MNAATRRATNTIAEMAQIATKPVVIGGIALLALDTARRLFRRAQLFCPTREPLISWNPADYGIPADRVEQHWIETSDGERLFAWYCRARRPIGSVLYCHGNSGNLTRNAHAIPHLLDAGVNVLIFDYRGFGRSSGWASLQGVVDDVVCASSFHDRIRPRGVPSVLYGYSLGGAIAAQAMKRHAFDGLILQSTFTSLREMGRLVFPRLPLHLLSGGFFDTMQIVKRLAVPLLVIHGTSDETVPGWMGRALYQSCPSRTHFYSLEGGKHNDLYEREPDTMIWAVNRFVTDLPRNVKQSLEEPGTFERVLDAALRVIRNEFRRRLPHETL